MLSHENRRRRFFPESTNRSRQVHHLDHSPSAKKKPAGRIIENGRSGFCFLQKQERILKPVSDSTQRRSKASDVLRASAALVARGAPLSRDCNVLRIFRNCDHSLADENVH